MAYTDIHGNPHFLFLPPRIESAATANDETSGEEEVEEEEEPDGEVSDLRADMERLGLLTQNPSSPRQMIDPNNPNDPTVNLRRIYRDDGSASD